MDNLKAQLLIWFLITLVVKCIDLSNAASTMNPLQHTEVQRGTQNFLDTNQIRSGSYEFATYNKYKKKGFKGIRSSINVWLIDVNGTDFSGAHMSMVGDEGQRIFITAGWMVNPHQFNDKHPRPFASYRTDDTVCYSFDACDGFVINDPTFFHRPLQGSTYDGQQHYMDLEIIRDEVSKNWLLQVWENAGIATVGYWKSSLFPGLNEGASMVHWGGFVFKSRPSPTPTPTPTRTPTRTRPAIPMGNGVLPAFGYNRACHIKFIKYKSKDDEVISPNNLDAHLTDPRQYPLAYALSPLLKNSAYGTHFFFGGPGRRSN